MRDSQTTINKEVLACIDGSRYSHAVCDYASWVSVRTGAPLTLLHNIERSANPELSDLSGAIGLDSRQSLLEELTEVESRRSRLMLEQGKHMLEAAKARAIKAGVAEPTTKQRHDWLTESLVAMEENIRVVVLGIRGEAHEEDDLHLGAQLESSIRALHRPILVVNSEFKEPKNVMLAYDGSEASEKALELSANSPLFRGLPIHLVTVGDSARGQSTQHHAAKVLEDAGHEVIASFLEGEPSESLVQYQATHSIDLILMGAFSHTRIRELVLGSLTAKMLINAKMPLLLLR